MPHLRRNAPATTQAACAAAAAPFALHAEEVREIFRRFSVQRPEPKGELEYVNAFTLLVAVVLSAQATDAGVNKATRAAVCGRRYAAKNAGARRGEGRRPHPDDRPVAQQGEERDRAVEALIRDHHGEVPDDRDALMTLPGVGRKTANVVLNTAFGQPTMAVDTHIFRLGNRLGLAPGNTPEQVEEQLLKVIPPEYLRHAHHWLILHGRYVCKARRPECERCIIADICKAAVKTNAIPAPLVEWAPIGDGADASQ